MPKGNLGCALAVWLVAVGSVTDVRALPSVRLPDPEQVVTQGGSAALEVPIPTPPGLGGFAPDLRLRYSSQGGDGPFGIGWSLGLSEIRRTTRFGPPTFSDTTLYEYELDGQLLIPETGSGATSGRFHTLAEGFQRILRDASTNSWSVTSPNGITAKYGTTNSSRVPTSGAAVRWHVSEMVDPYGNRICFHYSNLENVAYLDRVTYTHRGDCNSTSKNEIHFLYDENRPDHSVGYLAGAFWKLRKRVVDIEIWVNGAKRRRLELDYAPNGDYSTDRSRLNRVALCYSTSTCQANTGGFPATTYLWTDAGTSSRWIDTAPGLPGPVEDPKGSGSQDLGWRVGDLDGDGIAELVQSYQPESGPAQQGVYRRTESGYVLDSTWTASLAQTFTAKAVTLTFSGTNLTSAGETPVARSMLFAEERDPLERWIWTETTDVYLAPVHARLVDMNGDRRADLVASYSPGQVRYECGGQSCPTYLATNVRQIWLNNGAGWTPQPANQVANLPAFETLFVKESDGSGFGQLPGDASCLKGNSPCTVKGTMLPSGSNLADVDGDGLLDVLQSICNECAPGSATIDEGGFLQTSVGFVWDAGFSQLLVGGQGGTTIKHLRIPKYSQQLSINFVDQGVRYLDVNGDGLADLVKGKVEGANGAALGGDIWELEKVYLSTGTGWDADGGARFKPPTALLEWDPNDTGLRSNHVVFTDLNGDGLVDVSRTRVGQLQSWLQDPRCEVPATPANCVPNTVWRRDTHFDPPMSTESTLEKNFIERSRTKGVLIADFDGNAAIDFLKYWGGGGGSATARRYGVGTGYFSDRISNVENGEGGELTLVYESYVSQRDDSPGGLEAAALLQGGPLGEVPAYPLTGGRDRFNPPLPVVTEVTYATPDQPSKMIDFAYAGSMWDRLLRISWGPRLRRTYRADAYETRYAHQKHGIAGRTSRVDVDLINSSGAYTGFGRRVFQEWNAFVFSGSTATANGTWPGSIVGRLASESAANYYPGGQTGAAQEATYTYGKYNFITAAESGRPSGNSNVVRTPTHFEDPDGPGPWILGLPQRETLYQGLGQGGADLVRDTTYAYHSANGQGGAVGKVSTRTRAVSPALPGNVTSVVESWTYDDLGNPSSYTDPLFRVTSYCYDGGSLPGFQACPTSTGLTGVEFPAITVGSNAREAIVYARDDVTGEALTTTRKNLAGTLTAVDVLTRTLRPDGRIEEIEFAAPPGSTPETLETRAYVDGVGASITRTLHADPANAIETVLHLDGFGRIVKEVGPGARGGSAGVIREYDHADRVTAESYPAGCALSGCPLDWQDVSTSLRSYDGLGRLTGETSFDETNVYTYSRDPRTVPGTTPASVTGNGSALDVVTLTNPRNFNAKQWRDGERVVWVDDCSNCSDPASTYYAYEVTGEVRGIFNPAVTGSFGAVTNRTAFTYNTLGLAVAALDPDGPVGDGRREFTYDAAGNVRSATNARDQVLFYEYDEWNRLKTIDRSQLPGGTSGDKTQITYNDTSSTAGLASHDRLAVTDPAYSYSYAYDKFGRRGRETLSTQGSALRTDFAYDRLGRPTAIDYPSTGSRILYQYEDAHLVRICGAQSSSPDECNAASGSHWMDDAVYDDVARIREVDTPAGRTVYTYDAEYRLGFTQFLDVTQPVSMSFHYDGTGNLKTRTDGAVHGVSLYAQYDYDGRNRLNSFRPGSSGASDRTYTLDKLGNLTTRPRFDGQVQQQHFDTQGAPHQLAGVTPAGGSRINFGYDADGHRTQDPLSGRHFTWSADGRLTKVGTSSGGSQIATHGYDLDGRRIFSQFGTQTHVFAGDFLDYNTSASERSVMYIYAHGRLLATRARKMTLRTAEEPPALHVVPDLPPALFLLVGCAGAAWLLAASGPATALRRRPLAASLSLTLAVSIVVVPAHGVPPNTDNPAIDRFYVTDPVGSAVAVYDREGNHKARRLFDPFGEVVSEWSGEEAPQWYGGRPRDSASGLFDFHARWYDANTGGFLSVDPLIADVSDPQQHNAYAYARGNPVSLSDPSGLASISVGGETFYWSEGAFANDGPDYGAPIGFDPSDSFGSQGPGGLRTYGDLSPAPFSGLPGSGARIEVGDLDLDFTGLGASSQGALPSGFFDPPKPEFLPVTYAAETCGDRACDFSGNSGFETVLAGVPLAGVVKGVPIAARTIEAYGPLARGLRGAGLNAHHLIERRFATLLGQSPSKMLAIPLTRTEHQAFTNAWRAAIPYGQATANATLQQVQNAARQIYSQYPRILESLGL